VSLKIVLADDSLTAQNMGKKILADAGYEVIAVSNGAQAMKKIVSDKPDLVVLDVYMPGYSGLELCDRIRHTRETARVPVVLTVGKMEAFKPEEGNRVGADGLIVKPFEATELLAVVKKLTEGIAASPRPKRQPEPESLQAHPEPQPEPTPIEQEFEIHHQAMEVPQEIASAPVIGMDLISLEGEEAEKPARAQAPAEEQSGVPIEFEVEREAPPVAIDPGPRMSSAAGLSGVFELEPTAAPAAASSVEPAPVEELERFSAAIPDPPATTTTHEFQMDELPAEDAMALVDALSSTGNQPPAADSWPPAPVASSHPAFSIEPSEPPAPEAPAAAIPQTAEILPELASWDQAIPASLSNSWSAAALSAETSTPVPSLSIDPLPEPAAPPATGPVWVAQETEIDPRESAISLHEQMHRGGIIDQLLPSESVAPTVAKAAPAESWGNASFGDSSAVPETETTKFDEAEVLQEFAPNPYAEPAPSEPAAGNAGPSFGLEEPETVQQPEPPAQTPAEIEAFAIAAAEFRPHSTAPTVTEVPADPARIARIVDQVMERLKPELIAAVTRELDKKDR